MYFGEHNGRGTGGEREGNGRGTGGRREATRETAGRSSLGVPKTEATGEDAISWQKSGSPIPPRNG